MSSSGANAAKFKNRVKRKNSIGTYEMWITYNSNKKRLQIPVLPEEIRISYPQKNDTVYIYGVGDVTVKKHPGAFVIRFSSFFPATACQGSIANPKSPKECKEFFEKVMELEKPAKFIFTGSPCRISSPCTIDFEISEQASDTGTIYYNIIITEYKKVSVRKIKVKKNKKAKVGKKSKRASTKSVPQKYTLKQYACLQNISKEVYGNSLRHMDIYLANRKIIGSNPNRLIPGMVLTIPK